MQELAFNDACGAKSFSSPDSACEAVGSISSGIANLVAAGLAQKILRLASPVTDILLAEGLTLFDSMLRLAAASSTRDKGIFLQSLVQKIPIDNELELIELERIVTWQLNEYPGCFGLLLCASSNRIAVSATEDLAWHSDLIDVSLRIAATSPIETRKICNIFSDQTDNLKQYLLAAEIDEKSYEELWDDRQRLFPNLRFAPSVKRNLRSLGAIQYKLAIQKLQQLNISAETWAGRPGYIMDVRTESESTMNKYGGLRKFQDENGVEQTYILHFSVTDGFRGHIRELTQDRLIEVGYIGPHLKAAKKN